MGKNINMKKLRVENVSFGYTEVDVLENINLEITSEDRVIFLHGRNGAGKSTLLNLICGLLPLQSGSIERKDMKIAYLPYKSILFENLTVMENLKFFYQNFCTKLFNPDDEQIRKVITLLNIDYLERKVINCSSGERKKVEIACILFSNADLLILDEPFIAIDYQSVDVLIDVIKELADDKVFLITNHTNDIMERLANRLLVLDQHKIVIDTTNHKKIKEYYQNHDNVD